MLKSFDQLIKIFLISISLVIGWGALIYRAYRLNIFTAILILILAFFSLLIILRILKKLNIRIIKPKITLKKYLSCLKNIRDYRFPFLYIFIYIFSFKVLFSHASASAIISPWQTVPQTFFLLYSALLLLLLFVIYKKNPFANILIICHFFLSFAVALIIYRIGYGFDPFIHRATESLIAEQGAVDPKPVYYLGQYALIVILNKLFFIPIDWSDKLLVPTFAAITLPLALLSVFGRWLKDAVIVRIAVVLLLIIPYSFFIVTTPQNLSYTFFLLALIYGLHCCNHLDLITIYALALAACAIHPLSGIPIVLFAVILTIQHSDLKKYKNHLLRIAYILMALVVPLLFLILQNQNGQAAQTANENVQNHGLTAWPAGESAFFNVAYLVIFNYHWLILVIALFGFFWLTKHKNEKQILLSYFYAAGSLFVSYLITRNLSFNFLIDYERSNYSDRLLVLSAFFLLPFIYLALYGFLARLKKSGPIQQFSFGLLFTALSVIAIFSSYPRIDDYFNSRGYSTGESDIAAVRWINSDASAEYVVLANQQVSAAALKEFGFRKYFKSTRETSEDIFYYPIPTGGPLYQYYLNMVYEYPSRETVFSAMDLTGVDAAYFVLNKYWWAFPKILAEAKLEADKWVEIGNGELVIFKYTR